MTEKQKYALNRIMTAIPDDCRESFKAVAEYAVSLGYMPVLNAKETYADFIKSKTKRAILKIDIDSNSPPRLAITFFALPEYSGIFQNAIEERVAILKSMGHEPGCWGCGKCDGTTIGYKFTLSDGRKRYLCGRGVMTLPSFRADNVAEVIAALRLQDNFFMKQTSSLQTWNVLSND